MRVPLVSSRLYAAATAAVGATLLGCAASAPHGPRSIEPAEPSRESGPSGGTSTLSSREIARSAHVSHVEELFYHLPGVSVRRLSSSSFSVRIRGVGAPLADGEPLYVVDGFAAAGDPVASPLVGIPPTDVTHIEVLRPTAAMTMYGRRGRHGAIVITTKQLRRGR